MKKLLIIMCLLFTFNSFAIEVVKYEFKPKLILKIVRVVPDEFETYKLTNNNGRDMTMVCAKNRFYENNPHAYIEYRNFYNESAGKFIIENNEFCKDLATFIEQASAAVDEARPFVITLNKRTKLVDKIVYPKVDPLTDSGLISDLYLKPIVQVGKNGTSKAMVDSKLTIKLN